MAEGLHGDVGGEVVEGEVIISILSLITAKCLHLQGFCLGLGILAVLHCFFSNVWFGVYSGGMRGGKQVIIEPHRHPGVFIARGKEDALVTKNMVPGDSVYGEKRISVDVSSSDTVYDFCQH